MPDSNLKTKAALEALLFIHGEPLPRKKIMAILEIDAGALEDLLHNLAAGLEEKDGGMTLLINGDKIQLVTKPEYGPLVSRFVKEEMEEDLTPASLEALSLILYLGPIQKSRLDYLRGVNSSFILRNLLLRGLVERVPDPDRPSMFLYGATVDTLRHLGIVRPEDMPDYEKFRELTALAPNGSSNPEPATPAIQ